jgi:hypothetical protein
MRRLSCAVLLLAACGHDSQPDSKTVIDAGTPDTDPCAVLFGIPNANTGLTIDQCRPECACGDVVWAPPAYDAAFTQSLVDDWVQSEPFPALDADPYVSQPAAEDPPDTVCAVLPGVPAMPRPYTLVTYASESEARAAGASPTHFGHCGRCSPLADLAVYMRENDLTAPVRSCGITTMGQGQAANVTCLEALGFDTPCAQIWAYNTANTRTACLDVCMAALGQSYQLPDGTLNPCIQCDETKSGAVFKAVAGRTRRNSGLPNALCRPCSEVRPLVHAY